MFGCTAFVLLLFVYVVVAVDVFDCFAGCPPTGGSVAGNGGGSMANIGKWFFFWFNFNDKLTIASKRIRPFKESTLPLKNLNFN